MKFQYFRRKNLLGLVGFAMVTTLPQISNAQTNAKIKKKHCLAADDVKMPLGTKWVFTCNTDPKTKENVWYKYCFIDKDGNAKWSKSYTEYDPSGC